MLELHIPGRGRVELAHLVLDLNGTLARDGRLLDGVVSPLRQLRDLLDVHLLTADTFGSGGAVAQRLGIHLQVLASGPGGAQKLAFVQQLGAAQVVAMGNGANDAAMLQAAGLGIAVVEAEGLATAAALAADIWVRSAEEGLGLLLHPMRLVATLRE